MPQNQQEIVPAQNLPREAPPAEAEVGSWEPYLALIKSWQRSDEICAKAIERAEATRKEEETRAGNTFQTGKTSIEAAAKERLGALEAERKSTRENADRLLAQVNTMHRRVRQDMATIGLERLMDGIEVPESSQRGDGNAATTLSSLREIAERTLTVENSLQEDLFSLRAERQRQSAQMWTVGIGLWLVAVLVFAPYPWISSFLVGIAVFVMGTPRKTDDSGALRPSFASHIGHSIALLFGKQQVMQHPFSIVNGEINGNAAAGAISVAFISRLIFLMEPMMGYAPAQILMHLAFVSVLSIFSGAALFALVNQELTYIELEEGSRNKILK